MLKLLKRLRRNEKGNVLIIMVAAMPLMLGSAGLAVDTIQWTLWKRQLQRAADSAALAGVYDRVSSRSTTGVNAVVTKDLLINQHTGIANLGSPVVSFPANSGDFSNQVSVELAVQKTLTFSSIFMSSVPIIRARATAASVPGSEDFCVVSLENTTAMGIQGSGNGTVRSDCSWVTNSCATVAAMAKGSSTIYADVISACGGIQESSNFHVNRYDPYSPQVDDPYADLAPNPADMVCATSGGNPVALSEDSVMANYFNPSTGAQTSNCFSSLSVASGKTLTLPAGVYYLNGGGVNLQGTLAGTGVTIVLTNKSTSPTAPIGSFDSNAQAKLNITAPTTGKWAGMAVYQDRRAVDTSTPTAGNMPANAPNKINGGSASAVTGVLYFPKQQLTYNGGSGGALTCTQFVARRIQFSGNNEMKFSDKSVCDGTGVNPAQGGIRVRLVA